MNSADASSPPDVHVHPHTGPLPATVAWSRTLAVGSLLSLIALGLAWELVLAPTGGRTLALKVLPLALPLVGLLKNRMYTYRWVSLLVWVYFAEGLIRATGDVGLSALLAGVEVVLCLILFGACAVHVRWRLKLAKEAANAIDAAAALSSGTATVPPASAAAATPRA